MTSKNVSYFTERDNHLKKLVYRSRQLEEIERVMLAKLSAPLNSHLRLANISGKTAILLADSPAWSNQIRFSQAEILEIFANITQTQDIREIKIKTGYLSNFPGQKSDKNKERTGTEPVVSKYQKQRQRLKQILKTTD